MFLIEHENLAPVLLAEPLEPFLSESRPAIRVGPDERGHVPGIPGIHHGAESLAADVQAPPISSTNSTGASPRAVQNGSNANRWCFNSGRWLGLLTQH